MSQKLCKAALVVLTLISSSFSATAGSADPPLSPEEPPLESAVTFDMGVIRQDLNLPKATVTLGHAENGVVSGTINGANSTLTIQKGAQSQTFTFNQLALQAFPNDAAERSAFIADLNEMAFDRSHIVSVESYSFRSGWDEDSAGVIEPACALVPCRRVIDPVDYNNYHFVTTLEVDWDQVPEEPWWVGQYSQEVIDYDMQRWRQHVQQACDRAHSFRNSGRMASTMGGAGLACLGTPWTGGWTAAGCGLGVVEVFRAGNAMGNDDTICHNNDDSDYPGPTRW